MASGSGPGTDLMVGVKSHPDRRTFPVLDSQYSFFWPSSPCKETSNPSFSSISYARRGQNGKLGEFHHGFYQGRGEVGLMREIKAGHSYSVLLSNLWDLRSNRGTATKNGALMFSRKLYFFGLESKVDGPKQ